jgi:hypothetical protein
VLVTEYAPSAGIGWHKDRPQFDQVIGVSLLEPCLFRLRRKAGSTWERISFTAQLRSAYLLSGASRHGWEHSIPAVKELRYSSAGLFVLVATLFVLLATGSTRFHSAQATAADRLLGRHGAISPHAGYGGRRVATGY